MNKQLISRLLAEEESIYLEFKGELDLDSNFGKAKFLREVLSLANSPIRHGYLLLGVEDGTKNIVGIGNITEEQAQQVVVEWCFPTINFDFHIVEYLEKNVGVMKIYPTRPPYTLRKKLGFEEPSNNKKRKQGELRTNQVFVRRGSTVREADIDEIIEMAQRDTADLGNVVTELDKMTSWLEEIAYKDGRSYFSQSRTEEPNENLETTFIALLTGLILGGILSPNTSWISYISLPLFFLLAVVFSTFRLTHFGIRHALVASSFIGFAIGLWFSYGIQLTTINNWMVISPMVGIILNGFVSAIIGLIISMILMFWRPLGI